MTNGNNKMNNDNNDQKSEIEEKKKKGPLGIDEWIVSTLNSKNCNIDKSDKSDKDLDPRCNQMAFCVTGGPFPITISSSPNKFSAAA